MHGMNIVVETQEYSGAMYFGGQQRLCLFLKHNGDEKIGFQCLRLEGKKRDI